MLALESSGYPRIPAFFYQNSFPALMTKPTCSCSFTGGAASVGLQSIFRSTFDGHGLLQDAWHRAQGREIETTIETKLRAQHMDSYGIALR